MREFRNDGSIAGLLRPPQPLEWLYGVLALVGACTLLAALATLQAGASFAYNGEAIPWTGLAYARATDWFGCGLFVPFVAWLSLRVPLFQARWLRATTIHVTACCIFAVLKIALFTAVGSWMRPGLFDFRRLLAESFLEATLSFIALTAIAHAVLFYIESLYRGKKAAELQGALTAAQLQVLRAQLNPHFLFNTLNTVVALIPREPAKAELMIEAIAALLRETLNPPRSGEITLTEEAGLLERYINIMALRFGERLLIERALDRAPGDSLVPQFLLQPLVENAISAGVDSDAAFVRIRVDAHVEGTSLVLGVEDDAPEDKRPRRAGTGVGLENTRRRLHAHYGERACVSLVRRAGGGARAEITLPLRSAAEIAAN